jgi:hypothetical protein
MAKKAIKSVKTQKRTADDPLINHIRRGVQRVRDWGNIISLLTPGVGGTRILGRATRALQKVNRGY